MSINFHREYKDYNGIVVIVGNLGGSTDAFFGVIGGAHILEHMMIQVYPGLWINGITMSSIVNFIMMDQSGKVDMPTLVKYMSGWFTKDNITNHDITKRTNELYNETFYNSLKFGKMIDPQQSLIHGKKLFFTEYDNLEKNDNQVRKQLAAMFDYIKHECKIDIVFILKEHEITDPYEKIFKDIFRERRPTRIKHLPLFVKIANEEKMSIYESPRLHSQKSSRTKHKPEPKSEPEDISNEIIYLRDSDSNSIISVYYIPLAVYPDIALVEYTMNNDHGAAFVRDITYAVYNGRPVYFMEVYVSHAHYEYQSYYYSQIRDKLKVIGSYKGQGIPVQLDTGTLPTYTLHYAVPKNYTNNFYHKSHVVFITHSANVDAQDTLHYTVQRFMRNNQQPPRIRVDLKGHEEAKYCRSQHLCFKLPLNLVEHGSKNYYYTPKYSSTLAAIALHTIYSGRTVMQGNQIITNYNFRPNFYIGTDIIRSAPWFPLWIINTRIMSLMEDHVNYNQAVQELVRNDRLYLELSKEIIYFRGANKMYNNDLFIFEQPFRYFIHILKASYVTGDIFADIICGLYKNEGISYWADHTRYNDHVILYGIMLNKDS